MRRCPGSRIRARSPTTAGVRRTSIASSSTRTRNSSLDVCARRLSASGRRAGISRSTVSRAISKHKYQVAQDAAPRVWFSQTYCTASITGRMRRAVFYTSPFERALVLTLDGVGESESAAVFLGEGNSLQRMMSINFPNSLGLFYSVFTQYLGFEVNEGEYKVMGLAPCGEPRFLDKLLGEVLTLKDDGSFALNLDYFNFCDPERHYRDRLIAHLGLPPRQPGEALTDAAPRPRGERAARSRGGHLQPAARYAAPLPDAERLSRGRGRAELHRELAADSRVRRQPAHPPRGWRRRRRPWRGAPRSGRARALGHAAAPCVHALPRRGFSDAQIEDTLRVRRRALSTRACGAAGIARRLAHGEVVAILHGRDEWGPRALGARSILADPRRAEMKDHLNAKIKFREEFRPFAPVVMEEHYGEYFETLGMRGSPHMLCTNQAVQPELIAAAVHADQTSRVQTVNAAQNAYLYEIIREFHARTGVPVIINTSFNLKGEPIVSSPADALKTFYASGIDCLAMEDFVVTK